MELATAKQVHTNPVYSNYFADPFVWKVGEVYYAIGTGEPEAEGRTIGKIFPVLQSSDFYTWQPASSALERPDPELGANFWAPEVAAAEDKFYLYYSVGHGDKYHQLRVGVSDNAPGPFRDTGKSLLSPESCAFAIDPHPFRDDDGKWYLFYARDFLDTQGGNRAGTGLMVAPLRAMTELESEGQMILRPRHDWQRFQSNRPKHGGIWDWHTVEGPFVTKHDGRYYCFFSAGRWENDTYGVDYAVADEPTGPYSHAAGENGPRVLRTVPGHVLGPGHNSIITGPDGETDYIIYHAWDKDMKVRRMFIDKLSWTADGPRCDGPTWGRHEPVVAPQI